MDRPFYGSMSLTVHDGEDEIDDTVVFEVPKGQSLEATAIVIAAYYWDKDGDLIGEAEWHPTGTQFRHYDAEDERLLQVNSFHEISPVEYEFAKRSESLYSICNFGVDNSTERIAEQIDECRDDSWFPKEGQTEPRVSHTQGLDLSSPAKVAQLLQAIQSHVVQQPPAFQIEVSRLVQKKSLEKSTSPSKSKNESER